jgi:molybdenum cofactor cytidylyltransferase
MATIAPPPPWSRIGLVLLAAGRGERFGGDKLGAYLLGLTVLDRAAAPLASLPLARRVIVTAPGPPTIPAGFRRVALPDPALPQSRSLALGIAALGSEGLDAVLIALADMPLVPAGHYEALRRAFTGARPACSLSGETRLPPALFPVSAVPALTGLDGDRGARALLGDAVPVAAPAEWLIDIDRAEDLARAGAILSAAPPPFNSAP